MRTSTLATAATLLAAALTVLGTDGAIAAPLHKPAPSPTSSTTTTSGTGIDVAWPQCGAKLPGGQLFGIVGVNDGTAGDFSPCLPGEYTWATSTAGTTPQDKVALYINTANPAGQGSWWPTSDDSQPTRPAGVANYPTIAPGRVTYPLGGTVGCGTPGTAAYGPECAYVYGYVRAEQAVEWAQEKLGSGFSPASVRWWLDVETSNTWQTDTTANAASLGGAADYLKRVGLAVGVYSTTAQYKSIVGATGANVAALPNGDRSPLVGAWEWGAGASNLRGAQSNCGVIPFTGGAITLTQYVAKGLDYDVSCRGY